MRPFAAISCYADWCQPLPDGLRVLVLAAAIAIFVVTLMWAYRTIRRRRQ